MEGIILNDGGELSQFSTLEIIFRAFSSILFREGTYPLHLAYDNPFQCGDSRISFHGSMPQDTNLEGKFMVRAPDLVKRQVLKSSAAAIGFSLIYPASLLAMESLPLTPKQGEGPFYPTTLPLDSDNDLVQIKGRTGLAKGDIAQLTGRISDEKGRPVSKARVEIWQCDIYGRYHHVGPSRNVDLDPNFQGYGVFTTASDGAYHFRTIKPVAYLGRAPHIHFIIRGPGFEPLTTQMYVEGEPENRTDFVLNSIASRFRQQLITRFSRNRKGQLAGQYNIVLRADGSLSRI